MQSTKHGDLSYDSKNLHPGHPLNYSFHGDPLARSLLVFVHGGAWRSGDKSEYVNLSQQLASRSGCAVAAVNYRLSPGISPDPATGYFLHHPAHATDVLTALEYFVSTDLDDIVHRPWKHTPSNIFLVGHSCGAHILTSLFLRDPNPTESSTATPSAALLAAVRGITIVAGIYDVDLLLKNFPSYSDFIEGAFGARSSYAAVSNNRFGILEPNINWLIVNSPGDELIDVAQADSMWDALSNMYTHIGKPENVEKDCITVTKGHFELLDSDEFINLVVDFVRRVLRQ